jgi:AcrR family transcriptional regulator
VLKKVIPNRGGDAAAQQKRAEETRERLVAASRALFTEVGYYVTSTNDIVARAAVTRGALYHHFADKADLFEAVFRVVLSELNDSAQEAAQSLSGDVWMRVEEAFKTYLRLIASRVDFQRILLIDGPAVLGWRRWRLLQSERVAADITHTLTILMHRGIIAETPAEPLAYLIQAALNDAALSIAHADDQEAASVQASGAFIFLLENLRILPRS